MLLNTKKILNIGHRYSKNDKINPGYLLRDYKKKYKNKIDAYIEVANILKLLGERKLSKKYYFEALKFSKTNSQLLNKIGISFRTEDNLTKAEYFFRESIKNNSNNPDAFHNLGNVLRDRKKFREAIKFYEKVIELHQIKPKNNYLVKPIISIAKILECKYFGIGLNNYVNYLNKVKKYYKYDIRIATMSAYVSERENINNIYPFCKTPLNFIYTTNLKNKLNKKKINSSDILKICTNIKSIWEPSARVTRGGYQTIDNLFEKKEKEIHHLKKIIDKEINMFFKKFSKSNDFVIKKKPKNYKLRAWFVKLLSQGYQKSHIHPTAWLSGVFYLNVPKSLKNNQGCLKLAQYGYDYPRKIGMKNFIFKPKDYDLIIFPSSLFHSTIPYINKDHRCVVPFDLVPQKQLSKYSREQVYF